MKHLILFAGAVGTSKTPIANHLSWSLGLSILNNDAIRSEVVEDIGHLDEEEHLKRRNERLKAALQNDHSLIIDASIDRMWAGFQDSPLLEDCKTFIISLDLSKPFLKKLYEDKSYTESLKVLDQFHTDHESWLEQFGDQVNLRITDETFPDRLNLCLDAVRTWMKG